MKEINVEELLHSPKYQCIDVRSPIEFEEAHIPGAINIPLFTDQEREEIGTLYKKEGADVARWRAMEIVSPKIPQLMRSIRGLIQQGKEPAIYCWRGGMRSKAVTTFANFSGLPVSRLLGGYRAYRHHILENMGPHLLPKQIVVLHGMTGIGKTILLHRLHEKGWPILDLEGLANHRGSVFGDFGEWQAHSQKIFDALLFQALQGLKDEKMMIVEAESKRIGKVVQPDFLMKAKQKGFHIMLEAPVHIRTERIYTEYVKPYLNTDWLAAKAEEAFHAIDRRMSHQLRDEIIVHLQKHDYRSFISLILEHYYDPKYSHKLTDYQGTFQKVDATDLESAQAEIERLLNEQFHLMSDIPSLV